MTHAAPLTLVSSLTPLVDEEVDFTDLRESRTGGTSSPLGVLSPFLVKELGLCGHVCRKGLFRGHWHCWEMLPTKVVTFSFQVAKNRRAW